MKKMDIKNNDLVEVANKVEEINRKISTFEKEFIKQMYTNDVETKEIFSN